jgi:diguanylate cyclase (GGDEF)-like protein
VNPDNLAIWSLGVQLGAVILIALFFAVQARIVRLREARVWALSWWFEALALAAGILTVFHSTQGPEPFIPRWSLAAFCTFKTLAAALFVRGVRVHVQMPDNFLSRTGPLVALCALWGGALAFSVPRTEAVLPLQWAVVALTLGLGGRWALKPTQTRSPWLGGVLLAEALLYLAYVPIAFPLLLGRNPILNIYRSSSLIDAGAEMLLALVAVVAMEGSRSRHLERLNEQLQRSFEQLQHLADNDPLTGLINRRGSEPALAYGVEQGASLVFFDIDGFKAINDQYGHAAGDACLIRLAQVLRASFRPTDQHIRWGGDEMLTVAVGLLPEAAQERVREVQARLAAVKDETPKFSVSAGIAQLDPGGDTELALREADRAMYEEKRKVGLPVSH